MNFDTRPYQLGDLRYLREIYLASRTVAFTWESPQGYQLEDFDQATEDKVIWVAAVGDRPVGYISWWEPDNFVYHLFVDPHFTRRGIGSALLHRCLTQVGRPVSLKCVQRNTAAIAFYVSQGWRIVSSGHSPEGAYYRMVFDQE
ncbi:GNAT family N-acetyltransferase [Acaryochloris sp. CCMEE 5410]|uniref:GNAT family N-acetyltransferase n=1 Tax=Acaryochloris sp. CCMEE 5410 TaxID=310037 RepID=UPI000248498E|nr:GNAT family N-acetyltransferase [Acaryochloris sp. CCMEE 5410]KAI9134194.1 GNAT family N-acetyltransferase [Acaryochloris sp. CCMEE 5410]